MANIDWNNLENSADTLSDWFALYELSVNEIDITERQIDMLISQNTFFNPNKHKEDLEYISQRVKDYYRLKEVSKEKVLEYDNE